jgi:predicted HicB family RNase H-like nuclease
MKDTMEYKGYHTKPGYSDKDGYFFGKILAINDSVSFHGYSVDEFRNAFAEAVDDYLELCKEIGKPPETEFSGQFVLRIPKDIHRDLVISAEKQGVSLNAFITSLCKNYLSAHNLAHQ